MPNYPAIEIIGLAKLDIYPPLWFLALGGGDITEFIPDELLDYRELRTILRKEYQKIYSACSPQEWNKIILTWIEKAAILGMNPDENTSAEQRWFRSQRPERLGPPSPSH